MMNEKNTMEMATETNEEMYLENLIKEYGKPLILDESFFADEPVYQPCHDLYDLFKDFKTCMGVTLDFNKLTPKELKILWWHEGYNDTQIARLFGVSTKKVINKREEWEIDINNLKRELIKEIGLKWALRVRELEDEIKLLTA